MLKRLMLASFALAFCAAAAAQGDDEPDFLKPIDFVPQALGSYSWKVTTSSDEAQALFNQGIQLRWAYNMDESARSMASARRADPDCAMCYWGEAFGLGAYLNGGMEENRAPYARACHRAG
ncbi:MAG: hypothetical protein OEY08_04655, partial [Gammaproteobacteria bacterium]|nr:hypothetical protein [Gammaproteobacteria bacterium]